MDGQNTPSIPTIDPGMSGGGTQTSSLESILGGVMQTAIPRQGSMPSATVTGHASNPTIPLPRQAQMVAPVRPMGDTAMDKKRARVQNNWASVANTVKQFANNRNQQMQVDIQHNVTTVMAAQQQIDNASQIIQNKDKYSQQDVANAQTVLDKNKSVLNKLFSDKKIAKQMEKAFNVSFTDPEQNNTPEVKAMIAAKKEFDTSKQSGLNVDNPQEQRVQQLANGQTDPNAGHQQQERRMITSGQHAQSTKADQFLNQQQATINPNPAYAAAMKQAEEAQKTAAKIAPSLITQVGQHETHAMDNANKEKIATLNDDTRIATTQMQDEARMKVAGIQASASIKREKMAMDGAMARVNAQITSREKVMTQKGTSPKDQAQIASQNIGILSKVNDQLTKQIDTWTTNLQELRKGKQTEAIKEAEDFINHSKTELKENNKRIDEANARLSALGQGGYNAGNTSFSTKSESTTTTTSGAKITDGSSVGSDEEVPEPDDLDPS